MMRATANSMTDRERRTMNRRLKILALILLAIVVLGVSAGLWLYRTVERSLPVLAGEVEVPRLTAPVTVERDAIGVPTMSDENHVDASRALGFLHGPERFFQSAWAAPLAARPWCRTTTRRSRWRAVTTGPWRGVEPRTAGRSSPTTCTLAWRSPTRGTGPCSSGQEMKVADLCTVSSVSRFPERLR